MTCEEVRNFSKTINLDNPDDLELLEQIDQHFQQCYTCQDWIHADFELIEEPQPDPNTS